jgi:hypothetical protein
MTITFVDAEWALRDFLRDHSSFASLDRQPKVWLEMPEEGKRTWPMITVSRIGGGPENNNKPADNPRVSFQVWGGPGGEGRYHATEVTNALMGILHGLENEYLDEETAGLSALDITAYWNPDRSNPENILARYTVDATVKVRGV